MALDVGCAELEDSSLERACIDDSFVCRRQRSFNLAACVVNGRTD